METMGDLLERLREFARLDCTCMTARDLFGWDVEDVIVTAPSEYESNVIIKFRRGLTLEVRYFLDAIKMKSHDDCEFKLKLATDITTRVRYNVFYAPYIHGKGYMRIDLGNVENPMMRKILEEFYRPRLKAIYKPIILEFKGFFKRDFFGIEARAESGSIYYSPVRDGREERGSDLTEVVARLYHLDELLRSPETRHRLAELDVQMSFLPSVLWM